MHSKVEVKKVGNGIQTHSLCTNFVWRTRLLTAICSLVGILRLLQLVNSYSTLFNEQLQASSRACAVFQTKANRIQKYTIACSTHNILRREREREKNITVTWKPVPRILINGCGQHIQSSYLWYTFHTPF